MEQIGKERGGLTGWGGGGEAPRSLPAPRGPEPTSKEVREQENERCVEGMRGPAESVRKIPGWAKVGNLLRPSLCEAVEESKDLQRAFEEYSAEMDGKQWAERFGPVLAEVGAKVAAKMADALGASGLENVVGPTGWRHGLLGKMVEVAGDPEVDVPNWLGGKRRWGFPRRSLGEESSQKQDLRKHSWPPTSSSPAERPGMWTLTIPVMWSTPRRAARSCCGWWRKAT